ncbi:porin [Gymnodinialimonas hymeniacidonis]|uniref:porin n=1 Tax=Gymnodinialimonas hymeniacidonis TaxID=3126508 RepID=UPI0034C688A8
MIRPILLATTVVAMPALASAQGLEFDGSVTAGANFNSIGGIPGTDITLNGYSFDFDGDLHFDESFSVGIGAGFSTGNLDITGAPNEINVDLISLSIEPVYRFSSGAYVGGYYRMGDLDLALLGPVTIGIDTSQYGIFGGYDFGQGHVEAFYGMSELGDNALIPVALNTDVTDFGVSGSYEVMDGLDVFGSVMRTNIESGATSLPITAYAIGAEYDLGNGFDIYGSVGGSTFDLSDLGPIDDITAFGATIGASYDLSASGSMPLVLSAEYSRTNVDLGTLAPIIGGNDLTVDRFALGVTIPIGNGSTTPLNSNTRTARGEYRSAVAALVNSF